MIHSLVCKETLFGGFRGKETLNFVYFHNNNITRQSGELQNSNLKLGVAPISYR